MSQDVNELGRQPTPDKAEDNAFFPSLYSLSQYTVPKADFDGVKHKGAYKDSKWKVLMIAAEEWYVLSENGKMFFTGNHPTEMLLPLHHLMEAGFDVDVVTLSGYLVKLELWAMPTEDEAVISAYNKLRKKLKQPKKLANVIKNELGPDSDYLSVFIPSGHTAVAGTSESEDVQQTLDWALDNDRFVVTLCHGPAALLLAGLNRERSPLEGYSVCVFPDPPDEGANTEIGCLPGRLKWLAADSLTKQGLEVANDDMIGRTLKDRKLLTGDSPLALNELGKLVVNETLNAIQNKQLNIN